jgi:hypothetical protein
MCTLKNGKKVTATQNTCENDLFDRTESTRCKDEAKAAFSSELTGDPGGEGGGASEVATGDGGLRGASISMNLQPEILNH